MVPSMKNLNSIELTSLILSNVMFAMELENAVNVEGEDIVRSVVAPGTVKDVRAVAIASIVMVVLNAQIVMVRVNLVGSVSVIYVEVTGYVWSVKVTVCVRYVMVPAFVPCVKGTVTVKNVREAGHVQTVKVKEPFQKLKAISEKQYDHELTM